MDTNSLARQEPVLVAAVVNAAIVLAVAFGFHLTLDQQHALEGLAGAIVALAFVVRSQVTPTAKAPPPLVTPV